MRALLTALLVSGLFALPACDGSADEPAAGEPAVADEPEVEVTSVTLGRAVGPDMRITDETTTFQPRDTIYASVATEGVAPSATLVARWTYEDGQVVDETSRSIAPNGPEVTEFHVSKPDGWPAGGYEVVILLDGAEVGRESFSVEAGG